MLNDNENLIADRGYYDQSVLDSNCKGHDQSKLRGKTRAHHETFNRRLKQFNVLSHSIRHTIDKRKTVFLTVLNAVHVTSTTTYSLFGV